LLGLAVAGLLLLSQSRELANAHILPGSRWIAYLSIPIAVVLAAFRPRITRKLRHGKRVRPASN
jgi:TRAP-type C4-dicarboxylate transport system permease small subunit